jgi:hypothetical protein
MRRSETKGWNGGALGGQATGLLQLLIASSVDDALSASNFIRSSGAPQTFLILAAGKIYRRFRAA